VKVTGVAVGDQLFWGSVIIAVTVVIHVTGLFILVKVLSSLSPKRDTPTHRGHTYGLMTTAVAGIIAIHTVEIWLWASIYLFLGEFSELETALYFSAVTSTTLGYGDITLSEQWRLLGTFESMGGLILFGVSTAFLLALFNRLFDEFKID
jgi:hypothetical protein